MHIILLSIGNTYARAREQMPKSERDVTVPGWNEPINRNFGRTAGSPDSDLAAPTADPEIGLNKAGTLRKIMVMVPGPPECPRRAAVAIK